MDLLKNLVREAIGENHGMEGEFGRITWTKGSTRSDVDKKGLVEWVKRNNPELLEQFTKEVNVARRLMLPRGW